MKVNGKDDPIYYLYYGKYKVFETTNQINYIDPARGVSQPQATASPTKSTWNKRASNHGSTHKNHLTRGTLMVTCGDGPASAWQNGISGRRVEEITTFKEVSCFRGSCSLLSFFKKVARKMTGWWF